MDLGELVGLTIKVDLVSVDAYHGRYAWVYVKVELDKPLKLIVTVFDEPQLVEYEDLH